MLAALLARPLIRYGAPIAILLALAAGLWFQHQTILGLRDQVHLRDIKIEDQSAKLDVAETQNHAYAGAIRERNAELDRVTKRNAELVEVARQAVAERLKSTEERRQRSRQLPATFAGDNQLWDELYPDGK